MPEPLRPQGDTSGPETPEALMISALLHSGEFTPEKYSLTEEHLTCWTKLWRFATEYQSREGQAPPLSLVQQKFPEFELHPNDPGPAWCAAELHREHGKRKLRYTLGQAIRLSNEDDLDGAFDLLETLHRPRIVRRPPLDLWETSDDEDEIEVARIPVPHPTLGRITGGIGPGELWYVAGRPGIGKSHTLCDYVAKAVEEGYTVGYVSLEMGSAAVHRRVRRNLARKYPKILKGLDSKDRETYKKAIDELREQVPGTLKVVDPSHGRATNSMVKEQADYADLVVVDHIGLMWTNDGRKGIDDWRALATISNMLKQDCLESKVPILSAVQINREGEAGPKPPKLDKIAGTDAIGQDGDVVVTMKRMTKHVMYQSAEKVREGEGRRWYSRYDPATPRFEEISKDQAYEIMGNDEDFEES